VKIAFFDTKVYDEEVFTEKNKLFHYDIKFFKSHLTRDTAHMASGFDTVCVFVNDELDTATIDILHASGVKLIALRCAGFNNVDLNHAHDRIQVVRVPAYSPYAVAEHAVALMMGLNRKTHRAYYRIRDYNFAIHGLMGFDMNGKTAGVVGTGKIGKILIKILRGFGMEVLAFDAFPDEKAAAELGFSYTDMATLYRKSDIISLHCPLTPETNHMINKETLALMKPGVLLINTSRGGLIDTKALIAALKARKIGGAGLDVYEEEGDYFFEDMSNSQVDDDVLARLMTFNNVLVTSHQAFFTREALDNIAETTLGNIRAFEKGEKLVNGVCPHCS
jgi:D-lactate dehydrogenase